MPSSSCEQLSVFVISGHSWVLVLKKDRNLFSYYSECSSVLTILWLKDAQYHRQSLTIIVRIIRNATKHSIFSLIDGKFDRLPL